MAREPDPAVCTALVPYSENSPFGVAYRRRCASRYFHFCGRALRFEQCATDKRHQPRATGDLGFGGTVRDCAVVLARYVEAHPEVIAGKSVVEIGAGLGLVSTVCAMRGATRVVATDGDTAIVDACAANVERNLGPGASVSAQVLMWGDREAEREVAAPFDVVLAADVVCCVYERAFGALVETLRRLCGKAVGDHASVLLAYKRRHASEQCFFELLSRHFRSELVPRSALHEDFREAVPGQAPIELFRLTPR